MILIFFQSCDEPKKITRYDEIMMIHDDAMPRISEVQNLKKDLKKLTPSITDSVQLAEINYSIGELEEAEEMMMTWMNQWGPKSKGFDKESAEYQQFLKIQKKEIINVSDRIYHAMEHAKKNLHAFKK